MRAPEGDGKEAVLFLLAMATQTSEDERKMISKGRGRTLEPG